VSKRPRATETHRRLRLLEAAVTFIALALIAVLLPGERHELAWTVFLWSVLIASIELIPVPAWGGLTVSVGFPLLVVVAILYPPGVAGLVTLLGAADPRELKREVSPGLALFNRSQVALSVIAASATFHALASLPPNSDAIPPQLIPSLVFAAAAASLADYAVNVGLVSMYMSTKLGISIFGVLRQLTIGNVREFLVSYLGLGILGLTLAIFFVKAGVWSLPACLAPLLFARQTFFRSRALEQAHEELKEREEVLRELSNTMAEERADERLQIAAYLHDDLAQVLFRLSLQVDVARKLLEKGEVDDLGEQLQKIRDSKQETSDRIRALIRDLHRSPLGAKGLSEALESFTDEVARESTVVFHRDVEDIALPAPIALLVFHIAREGMMNALKHAQATDMWISVAQEDEHIVLRLRDNGAGFDTSLPGPEGHFGMAMMRERAKVGGGSLDVESAPGEGTSITVRFPIALLQRDHSPGTVQPSSSDLGRASLDTTGTTSRGDEGSRDSVPA
jgi:signal transduction histidine kinase